MVVGEKIMDKGFFLFHLVHYFASFLYHFFVNLKARSER